MTLADIIISLLLHKLLGLSKKACEATLMCNLSKFIGCDISFGVKLYYQNKLVISCHRTSIFTAFNTMKMLKVIISGPVKV